MVIDFLNTSSFLTNTVVLFLSFYFLLANWIFFYRWINVTLKITQENKVFKGFLAGTFSFAELSLAKKFIQHSPDLNGVELTYDFISKRENSGLPFLAVISSTSPFIGLFGTVVSILETFKLIGTNEISGINAIASGISEALVATAAGILVVIFAYSYHQILKAKVFQYIKLLQINAKFILVQTQKDVNDAQTVPTVESSIRSDFNLGI